MSEAVFDSNDAKNDERLLFLSNDSEELMQNGIFPTCDKFDIKTLVFSSLQTELIFF